MPLVFAGKLEYDVDKELRRKSNVDDLFRKECLIMKNLKKVVASVMLAGMLATMGVSAFADDAQYRSAPCDNCGVGTITTTVLRGNWGYAGRVDCVHESGAGQKDDRYVRTVTTYYSCTKCDYSRSLTSTEEEFRHVG